MERLEVIFWDVDGTLAETEEAHRLAFNRAFDTSGMPLHWTQSDYEKLLRVTGGKERIAAAFLETGMQKQALPIEQIAETHQLKNSLYAEAVAQGEVQLRPGVARLIAEAQAHGIPQIVVTTTSRSNVEALIRANWSRSPFAEIACAEHAVRKKPAPDVYFAALQMCGVRAANAIAIEDSQNGVQASVSAGIAVLAIPSSYTKGDDFAGASAVLASLDQPAFSLSRSSIVDPLRTRVDISWLQSLLAYAHHPRVTA